MELGHRPRELVLHRALDRAVIGADPRLDRDRRRLVGRRRLVRHVVGPRHRAQRQHEQ